MEVTFAHLIGVFSRLYPDNGLRMKYNIPLMIDGVVATANTSGNLIEFYNKVFVVMHNDYLGEMQNNILIGSSS